MRLIFTGDYSHTLDDRGRLAIPAKMREKLGSVVWVTGGWDKCLVLYPDSTWESMTEELSKLPPPWEARRARDLQRFFYSRAAECEIDRQGRILIPANLRQDAGITGNVAIVGAGDSIEIWDLSIWEAKRKSLIENPPSLGDGPRAE
jgi:MraZ protein